VWSCGVDEGEGKAATARFNAVGSWCFGSSSPVESVLTQLHDRRTREARFTVSLGLGSGEKVKSAFCAQARVSGFDGSRVHTTAEGHVWCLKREKGAQTISEVSGVAGSSVQKE
jgi:hypothetical protein